MRDGWLSVGLEHVEDIHGDPVFSCHTFRHTFCTRFCENKTNVKVIRAVMGHADINTTMDIYAEVTEAKKENQWRVYQRI